MNRTGAGISASGVTHTYDAVQLASSGYLKRATAFTGAADSKKFTLSFWLRPDQTGAAAMLMEYAADRFEMQRDGSDKLFLTAQDTSGVGSLNFLTTATLPKDAWHHVLISVDMADPGKRHVYIDNASASPTWTTYTDATLDLTGDIYLGALDGFADFFVGAMCDIWFAPGVYLDASDAAVRAKFYRGGKPAWLGATGELPTGSAPALFCHISGAETASNFATNRSGNGNLTGYGSITTAATRP